LKIRFFLIAADQKTYLDLMAISDFDIQQKLFI